MRAYSTHPAHAGRSLHLTLTSAVLVMLAGCAAMPPSATAPQSAPPFVMGLPPSAIPELTIGTAVSGLLPTGASQRWQVAVPPGSVVRGEIDATGLQLDVQDAQGRHVRRLLRGDGKGEDVTWLAQAGQQLVLHWRDQPFVPYAGPPHATDGTPAASAAPQAGQFRLKLTRSWAPSADQSVQLPQSPLQSPRLQALAQQLAAGGNTQAFWQEMRTAGTPLVEPWSAQERLVTFVWQGAQRSVRLFGSPSGNHESLQRLGQSDVWWASFVMPSNARLSYGFAPDVPNIDGSANEKRRAILATLQRDPLNPRTWAARDGDAPPADVYQGRSVLHLPDAPPQPWVKPHATPSGTFTRHWLQSQALGNGRDVWIYRPARWAHAKPESRALLVVFDAHAYRSDVPTPQIVDQLMQDGLIPPTAVVMVANASSSARGQELPPNPKFAHFMARGLMPWLANTQGLAVPASRTVLAGSSYGGLAASYVALQYPEVFANVLSLSGSYWWSPKGEAPNAMARWWQAAPQSAVRFYMDAGMYEGARGGQAGILETSRELGNVLRRKGHAVAQLEHASGHDYAHWQGSIACGLVALLNTAAHITRTLACAGR